MIELHFSLLLSAEGKNVRYLKCNCNVWPAGGSSDTPTVPFGPDNFTLKATVKIIMVKYGFIKA